jgi:hypothetical protein
MPGSSRLFASARSGNMPAANAARQLDKLLVYVRINVWYQRARYSSLPLGHPAGKSDAVGRLFYQLG